MQGTTKITHRFLPKVVSEMMVHYLWLILPFKQFLESMRTANPNAVPSPFIWSDCKTAGRSRKKWDTDRVSELFQKESEEILKTKLNVQMYRHITIAIARKHLRKDLFIASDSENEKAWDEQCVHDANTAGTTYARELKDAPGVVASRRDASQRVSLEWQTWLGFSVFSSELKRPYPFGNGDRFNTLEDSNDWEEC